MHGFLNKTAKHCEEVAYAYVVGFSRGDSLESPLHFLPGDELSTSASVAHDNPAGFQDHLAKYGLALVTGSGEWVPGVGGAKYRYSFTLKVREDTIS